MAVKKTAKKKEAPAVPATVEAKETAPKKKASKKAATAKAPVVEPTPAPVETPAPTPTPEPVAKKATSKKAAAAKTEVASKKAAAPKKAAPAPIKLSASQVELLKKVGDTAETGYTIEKKAEQRSIDALLEKKMIKKGAKDKATGSIKYHISSAGKKQTS